MNSYNTTREKLYPKSIRVRLSDKQDASLEKKVKKEKVTKSEFVRNLIMLAVGKK